MRHRAKGRQLSRTSSHRRALLNNMATSLFEHGRVVTTEAKAKELRPFAEKLITLARRGDLHARRLVQRKIKDRETPSRLFSEIGPRFAARPGGYTRILKLGHREGDGADVARIELLSECRGPGRPETTKGTQGSPFSWPAHNTSAGRQAPAAVVLGAFATRLLFRHCVHTRTRLGAPSTSTRTVCRLGYQRRFVRLLA